ncbi:MAG: methionyl-tRNA formyltransferase, partial [Fimbriimonas ginsengisoli]|nr:methionyl-tRNA formyltransferase [Fimbriimonas ginsengisoli]
AIAKQGGVNLHGSILPAYRGAAPIQRAILAGETETGVTLMQMDEGMDTGDVIHTGRLPIGPDETYGELQTRLAEMAGELARAWLPKLAAGGYLRTPQRGDLASLALKVHKSEAELSFDRAARSEYNRFRAFTPSPGAFLRIAGSATRISRARFAEAGGKPGDMIAGGEGCLVVFKDGSIDLLEVQPEGKKRMSGRDLANGWRLRPGASLR